MSHDWFYEATAAGVFIQAEILLFDRRPEQLQKYIPLLWRSLNHIESVRAENGLFLVGPACNLLAPSYGGSYDSVNDEVGKGYLTGITITYSAALKKCIEVMKLAGETTKADECYARLQKNISSLPLLLSEEGYLIKSMDPHGTKHGVYGAVKHGYFDAVCNIDAIAWDVVNRKTAESIYNKITSIKPLRSAGILCNNYPHIDDALPNYRNHTSEPSLPFAAGDWVDGGCWATVEGRAILAYQKLGKYEDSFRSAMYYMCWAEEYRQDAPLSQWGHNTNNPWVNENENYTICEHPVGIMIDNFAPVTCLLRGLFEYTADAEGLHITPHIPPEISELTQNEPIYFNGCSIYIHYSNGSGPLRATLDNIPLFTDSNGSITIPDTLLKRNQNVYLVIDHSIKSTTTVTSFDMTDQRFTGDITGVPHDIADIYYLCQERLKCSMNTAFFLHSGSSSACDQQHSSVHRRIQTFGKGLVIFGAVHANVSIMTSG